MTTKEFVASLEIVSSMGDPAIKTLADLLIEYVTKNKEIKGFTK